MTFSTRSVPAAELLSLVIDVRRIRAEQATAMIMHLIGDYITDEENDYKYKARKALFEAFYEADARIVNGAENT